LRDSPASGLLGIARILAGKGRRRPVLVLLRGQRWSSDGTASRRGGAGAVQRGDLHGGLGLAARATAAANQPANGAVAHCSVGGGGREARQQGPWDRGLGRAQGRARCEVAMQEGSRGAAAIPGGARDLGAQSGGRRREAHGARCAGVRVPRVLTRFRRCRGARLGLDGEWGLAENSPAHLGVRARHECGRGSTRSATELGETSLKSGARASVACDGSRRPRNKSNTRCADGGVARNREKRLGRRRRGREKKKR
jgi:hypothetical protein